MTKELEVNDNPAPDQDRQPREESGDKRREHNAQGEALQVNDNSARGKEPTRSPPRRGSSEKSNRQKLQGKALQVNENSVEDRGPAR
jgi:hypothetical protein